MRPHLYILEGQTPVPVEDALTWGRWFASADRHVARDTLDDGMEVSTVFLGIDHGYMWQEGPGYRPMLFETMVFKPDAESKFERTALEEHTQRYSTWAGAEHGHRKTVEKLVKAKQH